MAVAAKTVNEGDGTIAIVITRNGSLSAEGKVICYTAQNPTGIVIPCLFFLFHVTELPSEKPRLS